MQLPILQNPARMRVRKSSGSFLSRLWHALLCFAGILLLGLSLQILTHGIRTLTLPYFRPFSTAFIQHYLSKCLWNGFQCSFQQNWVPLNQISGSLKEAILIGEDDGFFEHEGIEPEAIRQAIEYNLKKGRVARGGSTITQQLVKNLYLSPSKNPLRKAQEILLSLWMEKVLSKQRILEIYLNVIEWGDGVYGAEAASQFYFHKPAQKLSEEEAAYLSAIVPNPHFYTNPENSKRAKRRKEIILRRMHRKFFEELSPNSS